MTKLSYYYPGLVLLLLCVIKWTFADQATDLIKSTLHQADEPNVVMSPYLLNAGMAELLLGSNGTTQNEIAHFLGISETDNRNTSRILESYLHPKNGQSEGLTLYEAHRLYASNTVKILESYQNLLNDFNNSDVKSVDFSNSKTAKNINSWVAEHTNNQIKDLVSNIDPDTKLMLVSALYFKGLWKSPFDPELTKKRPFYPTEESRKTGGNLVDTMMNRDDYYKYKFVEKFDTHALEIPYEDSDLAMLILMPKTVDGLANFQNIFDEVNLEEISPTEYKPLTLTLPKFKLEFKKNFNDVLKSLGVSKVFQDDADLSLISSTPLHVSSIIQQATIQVRENGTEAAAAQEIGLVGASMTVSEEFEVNHPFIYLIKDSNYVYFAGRVSRL